LLLFRLPESRLFHLSLLMRLRGRLVEHAKAWASTPFANLSFLFFSRLFPSEPSFQSVRQHRRLEPGVFLLDGRRYCTVLYGIVRYCTVLYGIVWYCMVRIDTSSYDS
jgi:hypothetical protein